MKPVSIRARADADIDAAIDHLLQSSPDRAVRFVDDLEAVIGRIAAGPDTGSPRYGNLAGLDGVRSLPIRRSGYHVLSAEFDAGVVVIRVLHERRDIPSLLADQ